MVHTNVTVNYWVPPANFKVVLEIMVSAILNDTISITHFFLGREVEVSSRKLFLQGRSLFFTKDFGVLLLAFLLAYLIDILIFNMICICSQLSNMLWVCKHVWIYRIGHEVNQMGVVLKDTFYFLCAFCCNSTIAIFDFTEINLQVWCWTKLLLS